MNKIIVGIVCFFILYKFTEPKVVCIEYYYDGRFDTEVQTGLDYWASNRMEFVRVDNVEDAYLKIEHVDSSYIKKKNWVAQYVPNTRTIMLNKNYDNYLKGQYLSSTVAHEAGHFIGLDHNNESKSIMNNKIQHDVSPTFVDKQRANDNITLLFYKKKLNTFLYNNDNNNYIGASY
jgi:hypothetical protein